MFHTLSYRAMAHRLMPLAAGGLLLLAGLTARAQEPAPAVRPNILLCFIDDWGRYASCYSDPAAPSVNDVLQTPNIDRIAREGVRFTNAFMGVSSCTPSRASTVTGCYFWRMGRSAFLQSSTQEWQGHDNPGNAYPGFAALLKDAGYALGKTYKTFDNRCYPCPNFMKAGRKFCEFSQTIGERPDIEAAKQELLGEVRANFRAFLATRQEGQPFLYTFGPHNTHRPWQLGSGKRLWGIDPNALQGKLPAFLPDVPEVREDIADYLGEVMAWDAALGVLREELELIGAMENTMVVLTGDNGIPGFSRGKTQCYDLSVEAPLLVRWPGKVQAGRVVEDFTNLIDLAPTFLEAAGLTALPPMDGRSLMPVLTATGNGQIDPTRDYVVTGRERHVANANAGNQPYPMRAIRTKDFLYIRNFKPERWPFGTADLEFRDMDDSPTKQYLLQHKNDAQGETFYELAFGQRPGEELYDLRADADQMRNLADDPAHAQTKEALAGRLMKILRDTHDPRLTDTFDRSPYVEAVPGPVKIKPPQK